MAEMNAAAQEVIDRIKAINYDEPHWNEAKVVEAFEAQYKLLGVDMPTVTVADNMMIGYQVSWVAARDAAWVAARDAAWDAARDAAARDAAARDAAARGAAWVAAALVAARDAAWDVAGDVARGEAARNTGLTDDATLKWIEISERELIALENGLGYFFPMKDKLILVPMPRMIMVGDALHYDHGKAVEWRDGTGFYFLRGVQFEEELYWKVVDQKLTSEETLTIPNADQRAAAISMLKPDLLLKQLNARLIDSGAKGTRLYEVKNFMDTGRTEYCMLMDDASTDRQFIEWTPPEIGEQGNAELCQAHAFGIPLEDWLLVTEEA